jgi:tetratricopeptide (TPR) repeat protein
MSEFLIVLLVVPALLPIINLYVLIQRLLQVRFRYSQYIAQSSAPLPDDLKAIFKPTIAQLQALGFELCHIYQVEKVTQIDNARDPIILLYHPIVQTFAEVEVRFPIDRHEPTQITFHQVFQDSTWLLTSNGSAHNIVGKIPDTIVADGYTLHLAAHWQYHQTRLSEIAKPTVHQTPAEFITALQAKQHHYIDCLLSSGTIKRTQGSYFLRTAAAAQTALQFRKGNRRLQQRQRQRHLWQRENPISPVPISIRLQVQTYHRLRAMEATTRSLNSGKWILLLSFAAFVLGAIALPNILGNFNGQDLVSLIGVLFLHEAGHFGAMKLFGYKDTKMFFLPLFGAAVTGQKRDASLSEKVWVLLAGPLPGLILGFGLMLLSQINPAFASCDRPAAILVSLNLLNLLPLYPLDGGKIAYHLLFSRYPLTDVIFKGITVLLFGIAGLKSSPILLILALATALSIPTSYRTAKINIALQGQGQLTSTATTDQILTFAFEQMAQPQDRPLSLARRDAIAKDLLDRQRENFAPIMARLGLAAAYSFSLLISITGLFVTALPKMLASTNADDRSDAAAIPFAPIASESGQLARSLQIVTSNINHQPTATAYQHRASLYQSLFALRAERDTMATPVANSQAQSIPQPTATKPTATKPTATKPIATKPTATKPTAKPTINTNTVSISRQHPHYLILQKALDDYNMAIKLAPQQSALYQERAHLYTLMGGLTNAIADYTVLIQRQPRQPAGYINRAELWQHHNNHKAAIADLNQALKLNPKNPIAYQYRSRSRQALGDRQGARRDQTIANQLQATANDI